MAAQARKLVPVLASIGRAEHRRIFHPSVDGVRIGQRWFQVPDPFELPGVLRAVEPLVRRESFAGLRRNVVSELVALTLGHAFGSLGLIRRCPGLVPRLTAVVGSLDDLAKPAAGLRRIQPIRVHGRAFQMVHLPAAKKRPADAPLLPLAVGGQNERALLGAYQNPYAAHTFLLRALPSFLTKDCHT